MVVFPDKWLSLVPEEKREPLTRVLANDPRPGYQADPERVYGLAYGGMDVHFRVEGDVLTVCGVSGIRESRKKTERIFRKMEETKQEKKFDEMERDMVGYNK